MNTLRDAGVTHVSDCLPFLPGLTELSLDNVRMGDVGVSSLCKNMGQCKMLARVDIRSSSVTDVGAACLADAIRQCKNLRYLNLSDNRIEEDGENALVGIGLHVTAKPPRSPSGLLEG